MKEYEKKAPMGWNSWDCYGASVNEETVRANAKYMAENLKEYGWDYIVVDIQWSEPKAENLAYHKFTELCMDEYSRLIPAENRFPSSKGGKGFGPLADYVHSLGLKFGIHIMRGIPRQAVHKNTSIEGSSQTARDIARTDSICFWNTDMYGLDPKEEGAKAYYESIFKLYASWGVDFIKCDDIAREMPDCLDELKLLSDSLHSCGRDMVLSLSPGPAKLDFSETYKQLADMWRITDDFWDEWRLLYEMFERACVWSIHTGPGSWPDADMLPIGAVRQHDGPENWTHFTEDEQITMLTLWSIMRSPLMIGAEMTKFDEFTKKLVTNKNILTMHKNSRNAHQVWRKSIDGVEHILWTATDCEGGNYIAIFNVGEKDSCITLDLQDVELYDNYDICELWSGKSENSISQIQVSLKSHGAKAYKI
jgi:hypothetical protein